MSVDVKTEKKGEETRANASVFASKIRDMVANMFCALEFASLQNLFETCNENRSFDYLIWWCWQLTVLELISTFASILWSSQQTKKFGAGQSLCRLAPSNFVPEKELCCCIYSCPDNFFKRVHVLLVVKKSMRSSCSIIFYLFIKLQFLKVHRLPLNLALIRSWTFFFIVSCQRNNCFLSCFFLCLWDTSFRTTFLFVERIV